MGEDLDHAGRVVSIRKHCFGYMTEILPLCDEMYGKLVSMSRRLLTTRPVVAVRPTKKWPSLVVLVVSFVILSTLGVAVPTASAQSGSAAQSCYKDDGRFDVTLSNRAGSRTVNFEVTLSGLASRNRSVAAGQSTEVTFTGRKDGNYTLTIRANGAVIENSQYAVACDPEVAIKVSCLQGNGRFDVLFANRSASSNTYKVSIPGLSPRSRTVPAGASGRTTVTGRPDNPYLIRVERNGSQVFAETFVVACDNDAAAPPSNENGVSVTCAGKRGRFDVNVFFTPDAAMPSAMFFEITTGKIRPRSAVLTQGSSFDTTITGRNNGQHDIVVRANGAIYFSKTVNVDC